MNEEYYEESSSVMSRKATTKTNGDEDVWSQLIHLMDKSTSTKSYFRRSEDIYRNRIRNDVEDLDVLSSEEIKSGYHYLYSRYEELWDYIWKIDQYVQKSLSCIKIHKRHDKHLASALSKPFNILSEYLYMKKNFEEHQEARQQQLEATIQFLDQIDNVEDLRDYYDFLRLRFIEFQEYTRMQENKLQDLTDLLYEITSSFEEEGEQEEAEVDENDDKEYFDRSVSSIPVEYENEEAEYDQDGFHSDRSVYEEQDESQLLDDETSLMSESSSPAHENQSDKTPRPPPPRRAVMPKDVKKKGLPPIPGHVISQARVAPESKFKIFQEKMPNYNRVVGSTGYGKDIKRRAPPSACVRKPTVVLPPLQQKAQYRSQQQSYSNEVSHHQDFMEYDESLTVKRSTVKGIVKPNLISKDLMKLRDPTVRPRGCAPKQTDVMAQEAVVRGLVRRQQVLPMIPQPPPTRSNNNNAFLGSRIPRLPTIQQNNRGMMSGIPRPCPPPQPPTTSRRQSGTSRRRYVERETALPFPKRQ